MKTWTLIIGLFAGFAVYGQTQANPASGNSDHMPALAQKGTYQLIFETTQLPPISIDRELLTRIESNRHESNETFFLLQDGVLVRILPRAAIAQGNFTFSSEESVVNKRVYQEFKKRIDL